MKTVIFLTERQLSSHPLDKVKKDKSIRLVLVMGESITLNATDSKTTKLLDEVYLVKEEPTSNILQPLNYEHVRKVVEKELNLLQQSQSDHESLHIICADEGNVLLAARLRSDFSLPGASYEQLLYFRDKELMKSRLEEHKIRVPKFLSLDPEALRHRPTEYYHDLTENISNTFVLKPTSSGGSDGVFIVRNKEDFDAFCHDHTLRNSLDCYEVEEYIDGVLYHVDTVINESKVIFAEVGEYSCPNVDFQRGKLLASIILDEEDELRNRLIDFVKKTLLALGMPTGSQHTEVFVMNNEFIFLESAARPTGLAHSRMYKATVGTNMPTAELYASLDMDNIKEKQCTPSFCAYLPQRPGKVTVLNEPDINSDYQIDWVVQVGDILEQPRSNLDYAGIMFVQNHSAKQLREDFETLKSYQAIEVE